MKKERIILSCVFLLSLLLYGLTSADFAAFLLAVLVIYVIAAGIMTKVTGRAITYSFSAPSEGSKGQKSYLTFNVVNESPVPVFFCTGFIRGENKLTGTGELLEKRFSLKPYGRKSFTLAIGDSCCGNIAVELTEVRISDPLNLFVKKIPLLKKAETEYLVLPVVAELPIKKDELDRYDMESYRYSQNRKGDDSSETFGIKTYVPGDNIKAIHWKLSGKMGDIVLREYGLPVENHVLVIADKRNTDENMTPEMKSEVTELYLSVLYTLAKQGLHHDAGWYDYNLHEFQWKKIMTTDDVYEIMPYILGSPFHQDRLSSADHYIESDLDQDYGSYIYITAELQDENTGIERLRNYGEVTIYRPENFKQ